MRDIEHPIVTKINKTGYTEKENPQKKHFGIDTLGNEVFEGEEVIVFGNEFALLEEINPAAREFLLIIGAEIKVAGED